jgi:hypothetical protein
LTGAEADLVRGAIGMMVDTHVAEARGEAESWRYGVEWFDQWDVGQRLWLLERVTLALLGTHRIESAAAIYDATVDAIFFEIGDLVEIEIREDGVGPEGRSWRESVIAAWECQSGKAAEIEADDRDVEQWRRIITRIADQILGVRLYHRAESFRDGDYKRVEAFLKARGLPEDYLTVIPPLRSVDQTQWSIDRIQAVVF